MSMHVWRPLPFHVEAIQYDGTNEEEIYEFAAPRALVSWPTTSKKPPRLWIDDFPSGFARVTPGWYVVKATDGTFSLVEPKLFESTHEKVEP